MTQSGSTNPEISERYCIIRGMQSSKFESARCNKMHLGGCLVESVLAKDILIFDLGVATPQTPLMCSVTSGSLVCYAFFCAIAHTCLLLYRKIPLTMVYLKRYTVQDI